MGTPTGRAVVAAATLGSGMTLLDGTVVNVALRTIGEDLDATLAELQWITNGYLLSLASLILLGGSLGDRFGRRRVFVVGTIWFAAASLLCGLAPTPEVLIAARILQGVGAALLTPGSLAMIQGAFRPDDRPKAIGAWSGLGGIAAAVGPFVGGILVDFASWRWIFLINLPLAAVTIWIAVRWVPESQDPRPADASTSPGRCWPPSRWPGSPTASSSGAIPSRRPPWWSGSRRRWPSSSPSRGTPRRCCRWACSAAARSARPTR